MAPDTPGLVKWTQLLNGAIVAPDTATFSSGAGKARCLDFFIVSRGMAAAVQSIIPLHAAPCGPHTPVQLSLQGFSLRLPVHIRVAWKAFPTKAPIGCLKEPLGHRWSWPTGDTGNMSLEALWGEWLTKMEDDLCHLFDLCDGADTPYRGRAGGCRRREAQLQLLLQRRWEDGVSPKGRA